MDNPVVISALLALAVALLAYAFFMPRNTDTFSPDNEEQAEDNMILRLTTKISGELYATLPSSTSTEKIKRPNQKIESLLKRSGNPWGLKAEEFKFFQYTSAFIGFAVGWLFWLPLYAMLELHWGIVVGFCTLFGFFVPRLKYSETAKKRDLEFKRHLPESLDLLVISLSAGNTFAQAVRESLPNMPSGVLKEEFREMNKAMDTGRTLSQSLEGFGKRAPNESIATFVKSVQEATELNVPIIEVLESRAEASRQEFFSMIHAKTAALSSKMMGILTPTLIPALMILVLAPAGASLASSMGGQ
jgi:tight adherence protein C